MAMEKSQGHPNIHDSCRLQPEAPILSYVRDGIHSSSLRILHTCGTPNNLRCSHIIV